MLILIVRTDKPEAEIGLYKNHQQLQYKSWQAHRELSSSLHTQIAGLLKSQNLSWENIEGLVGYKGPGSFTGLRIGLSVVNALADSLQVPVVGETGEKWIEHGIQRLVKGNNDVAVMPEYGSEPHITPPRA